MTIDYKATSFGFKMFTEYYFLISINHLEHEKDALGGQFTKQPVVLATFPRFFCQFPFSHGLTHPYPLEAEVAISALQKAGYACEVQQPAGALYSSCAPWDSNGFPAGISDGLLLHLKTINLV